MATPTKKKPHLSGTSKTAGGAIAKAVQEKKWREEDRAAEGVDIGTISDTLRPNKGPDFPLGINDSKDGKHRTPPDSYYGKGKNSSSGWGLQGEGGPPKVGLKRNTAPKNIRKPSQGTRTHAEPAKTKSYEQIEYDRAVDRQYGRPRMVKSMSKKPQGGMA